MFLRILWEMFKISDQESFKSLHSLKHSEDREDYWNKNNNTWTNIQSLIFCLLTPFMLHRRNKVMALQQHESD